MTATQTPDIKSRILTEATRLFAERGFDATSLSSVAAAVGIRKPSLLYHFGSKDALRQHVLAQMLDHWKDDLPRVLTAATSGKDRLYGALSATTRFFRADRNRARLLVREMLDRPTDLRALFRQHLQPWTSLLTDYIRTGKDNGIVHEDLDPAAYVVELVMMTVGSVALGDVTSALLTEEPDLDRQLTELARVARSGLFKPRPPAAIEPQET